MDIRVRNILSLFIVLLLLSQFVTSCNFLNENIGELDVSQEQEETSKKPKSGLPSSLSLAINPNDTLNPYKARTTLNISILPLLYDSCVRIDSDFSVVNEIAQSVKSKGKTYTVKLKEDLKFSDESPITANDVVYSLQNAARGGYYAKNLTGARIRKTDDFTVKITLREPDVLFLYNLTVPIVKKGSLKAKSAIGSGRFVYNSKKKRLEYNKVKFKKRPRVRTVDLVEIPNEDDIVTGIKLGMVSLMYYDMSKGKPLDVSANIASVDQNNLIYLGINKNNKYLKMPEVRKALSLGVNRQHLATYSFTGYAKPSLSPINPKMIKEKYEQGTDYNISRAKSLMSEAGFTETNTRGILLVKGKPLKLQLLVNKSSPTKVAAAYELENFYGQIGIEIDVKEVSSNQYKKSLSQGKYQLFIGEVALKDNCSLSPLISGKAAYGTNFTRPLRRAYTKFLEGSTYSEFMAVFEEQTPFIPLLFKDAVVIYSRGITYNLKPSINDIFANINR